MESLRILLWASGVALLATTIGWFGLKSENFTKTKMPRIIYGTAWKRERTAPLVLQALTAGFRGVDTACQPKHYNERGVGEGIAQAIKQGIIKRREDLFIQTKFTPLDGQDRSQPLPYNEKVAVTQQVQESVQSSLKNLGVEYIDSLVLHSPLRTHELTMEAWRAMEIAVEHGLVSQLGVSNLYDPKLFQQLLQDVRIKPRFLQNRFYAESGFDTELREICIEHNITYQSFWTLTANWDVVRGPTVAAAANRLHMTPEQTFLRYVIDSGMVPLSGTKNPEHMRQDVAMADSSEPMLTIEELHAIRAELYAMIA